jgi:amino-acid N-acetyltransferase
MSSEPVHVASSSTVVRRALPADARGIRDLVAPYAERHILIPRELVGYFETIQEFVVAQVPEAPALGPQVPSGQGAGDAAAPGVVGCGALHVMWDDLAEVRTLAVHPDWRRHGIGHRILSVLLERAREMGLRRVFCLTFEVHFFTSHGFDVIEGTPVDPAVYGELLRSHDDGVAEFLDLAHVKPNTLGNTRMLLELR